MSKIWAWITAHKVVSIVVASVIVVGIATGIIVPIAVNNSKHKCEFTNEWTYDENNHWHACTDKTCTQKSGESAHTYNVESATESSDKHCTVCGYVAEQQLNHTHTSAVVDEVGSTCEADGVKAYYTCSSCGKYF